MSSGAGHRSFPWAAVYGATKFAQRGFLEALRHELSGTGVGVTGVYPGQVKSHLHDEDRAAGRMPDWYRPQMAIEPERIARATVRAVERGDPAVYEPRIVRLMGALHGPGIEKTADVKVVKELIGGNPVVRTEVRGALGQLVGMEQGLVGKLITGCEYAARGAGGRMAMLERGTLVQRVMMKSGLIGKAMVYMDSKAMMSFTVGGIHQVLGMIASEGGGAGLSQKQVQFYGWAFLIMKPAFTFEKAQGAVIANMREMFRQSRTGEQKGAAGEYPDNVLVAEVLSQLAKYGGGKEAVKIVNDNLAYAKSAAIDKLATVLQGQRLGEIDGEIRAAEGQLEQNGRSRQRTVRNMEKAQSTRDNAQYQLKQGKVPQAKRAELRVAVEAGTAKLREGQAKLSSLKAQSAQLAERISSLKAERAKVAGAEGRSHYTEEAKRAGEQGSIKDDTVRNLFQITNFAKNSTELYIQMNPDSLTNLEVLEVR